MDADKLLKQGMEMAEKLRDTAGEQVERHEDQIRDTLGKVTGFVNEKTGGKYADQVSKAVSFLERGVDMLAAQSPRSSGPEAGSPASDASAPRPGGSGSDSTPPTGAPTQPPSQAPTAKPDEPSAG